MEKVASLISGGMDSCTTMAKLVLDGWEVYPIYVNYGQVASSEEVKAAKKYIENLQKSNKNLHDIEIVQLSLPFLKIAMTGSRKVTNINEEDFHTMEAKKVDWVPARNIIFLTVASSYCGMLDCRNISIGAYKEDEMPPYPDSSREFFDALEDALTKGMYGDKFNIVTPFVDSFKWDLVKYSKENNLPIEITWSCYEAGDEHCGLCRNCIDRKKSFQKANTKDPTKYVK
ncbi:MAG: 7-cyano-7-deazaguanine synthase [Candidatus Aenigmarchaeota archaeon]|nr:7-cyano-7-deazaguanine synthase [Candidatus Aenigmarchaeota archaeon]